MLEHYINRRLEENGIEDRDYTFRMLNQLERTYNLHKERLYYRIQQWYRQSSDSEYIKSEDLINEIQNVEKDRLAYINFKNQVLDNRPNN